MPRGLSTLIRLPLLLSAGRVDKPLEKTNIPEEFRPMPSHRSTELRIRRSSGPSAVGLSCGRIEGALDEELIEVKEPLNSAIQRTAPMRAYLWSYCTTGFNAMRAVVFDFAEPRGSTCQGLP